MFAYCGNNPVNKTDIFGEKPGDLFDTIDDAARDFAFYINGQSILDNREYATAIYAVEITVKTYETVTNHHRFLWWEWTTESKQVVRTQKTQYTYAETIMGSNDGIGIPSAPRKKTRLAIAHTHGAYDPDYFNDIFSAEDISVSDKLMIPSYLATPIGTLRKYDPTTGEDSILYIDIPFDPNHPLR